MTLILFCFHYQYIINSILFITFASLSPMPMIVGKLGRLIAISRLLNWPSTSSLARYGRIIRIR